MMKNFRESDRASITSCRKAIGHQPTDLKQMPEDGGVLIVVAIGLFAFVALMVMVIEYATVFHARQQLQKQVDASALAGAMDLPTVDDAKANATRFFAFNLSLASPPTAKDTKCASGASKDTSCYTINDSRVSVTTPYTQPGSSVSPTNLIHVVASRNVDMVFARMVGYKTVPISAAATAKGCICDLGYPFKSTNGRTSVPFNESEVLRGFGPQFVTSHGSIRLWYSDEHPLTLGISQIKAFGATRPYTVTPMTPRSGPSSAMPVEVGATAMTGNFAGTDPSDRPMFPAIFVTDITTHPELRTGDWQYGGTPIPPTAVFGTWKSVTKKVTRSGGKVTVTIDAKTNDTWITKNVSNGHWNLGSGSDPVPPNLEWQDYGAEIRWDVASLLADPNPPSPQRPFQKGHIYRVQFIVHDGDQNNSGGDVGQNCVIVGIDTDCGGGLRE
jgi:Flp pilus assembly protein TadG